MLMVVLQVVDHVPVIQLETPAGSIVENFSSPRIMRVPRNRMRNVKNTANLFPLQSKCVAETPTPPLDQFRLTCVSASLTSARTANSL